MLFICYIVDLFMVNSFKCTKTRKSSDVSIFLHRFHLCIWTVFPLICNGEQLFYFLFVSLDASLIDTRAIRTSDPSVFSQYVL